MSAFPIALHSEQVELPSKRKPGLQESSGAHVPPVATPHTLAQDVQGRGLLEGRWLLSEPHSATRTRPPLLPRQLQGFHSPF